VTVRGSWICNDEGGLDFLGKTRSDLVERLMDVDRAIAISKVAVLLGAKFIEEE